MQAQITLKNTLKSQIFKLIYGFDICALNM